MDHQIRCQYIGHATTVLQLGDASILTDPHFGARCGFFKRTAPLPVNPGELPDLSCVLLSHTHFDHLDISSYKFVSCGTPIIVPEGCEPAVGRHLPNPVIELNHYAHHELPCGIEITALPVLHSQGHLIRYGSNRCNAYFIRQADKPGCIFFCGDSAYGPHFREIGNLGQIDLALLPIGSYGPAWLMRHHHMTPAEAVNAFEDLRARHFVPIHHGTFKLSFEARPAPAAWLRKICDSRTDLAPRVHLLNPGEGFETAGLEAGKVVNIDRVA